MPTATVVGACDGLTQNVLLVLDVWLDEDEKIEVELEDWELVVVEV
jgi:hypothetical protein